MGNAALARLRVVLIGSKRDFVAALENLGFAATPGELAIRVAAGLPWGRVDEDGGLELLNPPAASGQPLIALCPRSYSQRPAAR